MSAGRPGHEADILASIEAEFRERDPGLVALFDGFDKAGHAREAKRRPAGACRARLLAALVFAALALALMLTGAHLAGWQGCASVRRCPAITSLPGRAVAAAQARTAELARDIRAEVCQSVPDNQAGTCG